MDAVPEKSGGPNWLLWILFGLSALAHFFLLMYAMAPLSPEVPQVIDLTLREIPPPKRMIPSPPSRSQIQHYPKEVVRKVVREVPVAPAEPVKPDVSRQLVLPTRMKSNRLHLPEPEDVPGLRVSEWVPKRDAEQNEEKQPGKPDATAREVDTASREEYLNTIRHLIERQKEYPKIARLRKFQGKVVIELALCPTGEVKSLRIAEGSRFDILNGAAMRAAENAAPYPRPPAGLFPGDILLRIPVVFELI